VQALTVGKLHGHAVQFLRGHGPHDGEKSLFSSGSTTWVSGSPKRQLYSMTLGPFSVSIRPKY
jgi:hypothetical protein